MSDTTHGLIPQYLRIRRQIEARIRCGDLAVGERIPGERELASQFGVSQMTANRAIQELVRDGLLLRRAGSGTYVCPPDGRAAVVAAAAPRETVVLVVPFAERPEHDIYLQVPFAAISGEAGAGGRALAVEQSSADDILAVAACHPHGRFLFAAPNESSLPALRTLRAQGVPLVVMGASWPDAPFACVDTDNAAAEATAVAYLARLGHRRIAFVNGPCVEPNNRDRLAGYLRGMAEHGLVAGSLAASGQGRETGGVVEAESNAECGPAARRRVMELLMAAEPATAIVCAGFSLTLSILGLLRELELRVPEDVSIVGFDDPPAAAHLGPPLTTFRQPLHRMGARAIERLLSITPGTAPGQTAGPSGTEYLPIEFVPRGSCARVARHEDRPTSGPDGRGR